MVGGSALAIAGGIIFSDNFCPYVCSPEMEQGQNTGIVMLVTGGLAAVGSIPLFISSNNAKKSRATKY